MLMSKTCGEFKLFCRNSPKNNVGGCVSSVQDRVCPGLGRAAFPVPQRWDGSISDLGISWCLRMSPELFVLVCGWAFIRPDFYYYYYYYALFRGGFVFVALKVQHNSFTSLQKRKGQELKYL